MCVTNNVRRAPRQLAEAANPNSMISKTPSLLSQRLQGNFMPLMMSSSCSSSPRSAMPMDMCLANVKPDAKKPRRRRKPQKPGKTAKQNDRHFVVHNYHDHSHDLPENDSEDLPASKRRGGVSMSFPIKLHAILDQVEEDGLAHVISWQPHGRCFVIHNPKEFTDHVMPKYFRQTKLTSFQRQLNLYGFSRLTIGKDNGGYYHELFLRGKVFLAKRMGRTKIKGTKFKAASSPDNEPDFYSMDPVTITPPVSDESSVDDSSCQSLLQTSKVASMPLSLSMPEPIRVNTVDPFAFSQMQAPLQNMFQWQAVPLTTTTSEDNAFDAAIDEIFEENGNNYTDDFSNIFDPEMAQIPDSIEDDNQLGNILEQLLQNV